MAHEILYNNFELSLVVFMPNITKNMLLSIYLYYYLRNFCNLIGVEQWYFSLILLEYLHVKITNLFQVVV